MPNHYRKRRRGRSTVAKRRWLDFKADLKREYGVRKYFTEVRDGDVSLAVANNLVGVKALPCIGCSISDRVYLAANGGQSAQALDDADGKHDDMVLGGGNTNLGRSLIYDEKMTVHMRNVTLHPQFVKVYECVAKRAIASTDSVYNTPTKIVLHDFAMGMFNDMESGTTVTGSSTVIEGDKIITYTPGAEALTMYSRYIGLNNSTHFRQNWRVAKQHKFKLAPGDDIFWKLKARDHIYDPQKDLTDNGLHKEDAPWTRPGLTTVLVVMAHGAMGAVTTDVGVMGLLGTDLAIDYVVSAKILPMNVEEPEKSFEVIIDAADNTGDLVAPSAFLDAVDEANVIP